LSKIDKADRKICHLLYNIHLAKPAKSEVIIHMQVNVFSKYNNNLKELYYLYSDI